MNHFIKTMTDCVHSRIKSIPMESNLTPNKLNFYDLFQSPTTPAVIAEIKFASPSHGRIYPGTLDPVAIASEYLANGANALSIVTEPTFFQGTIETVKAVRTAFPTAHILLKDFVLSKQQIAQGLAYGANAVLLIVAFLTAQKLKSLYEYAQSLNLTPLIEVHTVTELETALALNPKLIGINHRNLNTLSIDLDVSETLIKSIPADILVIAESGIQTRTDLNTMACRNIHGCLIGCHFMKDVHPGQALKRLLRGEK